MQNASEFYAQTYDESVPDWSGEMEFMMNTKLRQPIITPTDYADVNEILNELLTNSRGILGENFVGMYLDGSLASGDFDYETSDIDFVVATAVSVTSTQFDQLVAMHNRIGKMDTKWAIELEGAYLPLDALRRHDPANATHPYIDRGESNLRWEPLEVDWIIHRYVLHNKGITLVGPLIQTLVDPVSKTELQQAVRDLLDIWWVPMIADGHKLEHDGYRCYAIMTMCRMLYTAVTGDVTSKPKAAQWVLATQDVHWHPQLQAAMRWHWDTLEAPVNDVQKFIEFTRAQVS